MQLSCKIWVRQNSIGNASWMSPGPFFIYFGIDFGGPGVIFESLGASLSKVIFKRILGGLGEKFYGNSWFLAAGKKHLADLLDVLAHQGDGNRNRKSGDSAEKEE